MLAALPFPDIAPEIFSLSLFGMEFALRWYALAYIAGLGLGWWLVARMMKRPALWGGKPPMTPKQPEDLLTWMVLGVVLGGRLGFVLFYNWDYYSQNPGEILAVWQGGMSFHGGLLGVMAGIVGYSAANRLPVMRVADAVAAVTPVGLFFGRVANFINAELWGRPTNLPWGVAFPSPAAQICPPEFGDPCGRHPSQLYEAGLEGLVLGLVILWGVTRLGWLRTPGRVTGVFLLGYGLARTIVEGFRQADVQFVTPDNPFGHVLRFGGGIDAFGLTMGQLLSLPMVGIGLAVLLVARKRA
ncbi:prolipoprotein diacylglyceryl transferase [Halovulum dunhuangense]|uniref:Phosphatidylglycerol--prolipoprotein diacylglyceryl transferase n=1 Tax=Halovulum dunhuangense TaxID=1505036 RepID=A0A849L6A1_9RHOB|nr:prolipoprotein diacylglyceryl transferase [Halovulum dunhuangense]NNU81631.1 prolipoprotein diacylglyceryl transferase [Halovulum dunhuangense]